MQALVRSFPRQPLRQRRNHFESENKPPSALHNRSCCSAARTCVHVDSIESLRISLSSLSAYASLRIENCAICMTWTCPVSAIRGSFVRRTWRLISVRRCVSRGSCDGNHSGSSKVCGRMYCDGASRGRPKGQSPLADIGAVVGAVGRARGARQGFGTPRR